MYNKELWEEILEKGLENQSHKETNVLAQNGINAILGTMEFFGCTHIWIRQSFFDLARAKFRVFDWLAMCINGRNDDDRRSNNTALKVLVHAFKQANYNEHNFIELLATIDYDIFREWEAIKIDID